MSYDPLSCEYLCINCAGYKQRHRVLPDEDIIAKRAGRRKSLSTFLVCELCDTANEEVVWRRSWHTSSVRESPWFKGKKLCGLCEAGSKSKCRLLTPEECF